MTNVGANVMYMTMWGAYFVWAYFICATLENLTYDRYRRKSFFNNLWKVAHFLFELAWVFQLVIVIIFWVVLFPQLFVQNMPMFLNVNIHGVFFILLVLDFVINNVEFHHRHFIIIVVIALCYLLFVNVPYTLIWKPIYPGINWCRSGSTGKECLVNWLIIFGALSMFLLQYFIGFKIYKLVKEKRILRRKQDQILGSISDSLTDDSSEN